MDSSPTPPEFSKTRATLRDERASTPEDLWSNVEASVNGGSAASSGPAKAAPVAKRASTSETVHHVAGGNLGKRPAPASSSQPGGAKKGSHKRLRPRAGHQAALAPSTPDRTANIRPTRFKIGTEDGAGPAGAAGGASAGGAPGSSDGRPALPPDVADIYGTGRDDAEACVDYLDGMYRWHRHKERQPALRTCAAAITAAQTCFRGDDRALVVDWMSSLQFQMGLRRETLAAAVTLLDRALAVLSVRDSRGAETLAAAVLHVSAKVEEIAPPPLQTILATLAHGVREADVLKTEARVCALLAFRLAAPNVQTFLPRAVAAARFAAGSRAQHLCHYLAEVALASDTELATQPPSLLASAVVAVARATLCLPVWDATLRHYTGYAPRDVRDCAARLATAHLACESGPLRSVWRKYSAPAALRVACVTCVGHEAVVRGLALAAQQLPLQL